MTPEQITGLLLTIADLRVTIEQQRARILELEAGTPTTPPTTDGAQPKHKATR